jgi:hypothetical protein
MDRMTKYFPTPVEDGYELSQHQAATMGIMPTTLRAAVKMFPEAKVLTEESIEFGVAIEIEGVLHNRSTSANDTVDVVFVIDNGYVFLRGTNSNWLTVSEDTMFRQNA